MLFEQMVHVNVVLFEQMLSINITKNKIKNFIPQLRYM